MQIKITRSPAAQDLSLPTYMSEHAAGMDILAAVEESFILKKGEIRLIPTGISIAVPPGYEAQIRPRSGLALKHGITLPNSPGTIDADYRGEIGIITANYGPEDFEISRGMRIAQMVIAKVETIDWELVEELSPTDRGSGGFGSTGKHAGKHA